MPHEYNGLDRREITPFLLRVFPRSITFHRPDEFAGRLPDHLCIYTWQSCTLKELCNLTIAELAEQSQNIPTVGTRLAFRLIYPDPSGRYIQKDLGSVVVGPGLDDTSNEPLEGDSNKTLAHAGFVAGDYISCAIIPTLANGDVAPPPPRIDRQFPPSHNIPREIGMYGGGRGSTGIPAGDWRRGDDVPPIPRGSGRGRTRGTGRGRVGGRSSAW